jgi:hypothetical protein
MSNNIEELKKLLSKVETLKNELGATAFFDSSVYFTILQYIEAAGFTKQQLIDTLTDYAGGFQSRIESFLSKEKPRHSINSKLQTVFQP